MLFSQFILSWSWLGWDCRGGGGAGKTGGGPGGVNVSLACQPQCQGQTGNSGRNTGQLEDTLISHFKPFKESFRTKKTILVEFSS